MVKLKFITNGDKRGYMNMFVMFDTEEENNVLDIVERIKKSTVFEQFGCTSDFVVSRVLVKEQRFSVLEIRDIKSKDCMAVKSIIEQYL